MSINTNHSNIQFEKEFLSIKKWIKKQVPSICGYGSETVQARLMQYLVAVSLPAYAETAYALTSRNMDPFPFKDRDLDFGGGNVGLDTGCVSINSRQWIKGLIGFIAYWVVFFLAIIIVKKSSEENDKATLVYDVGDDVINVNNSDEEFVNYCRLGPIKPLNSKNKLYIQCGSDKKLRSHHNFHYCKQPLISVLRSSKLGLRFRLALLLQHIILLFTFFTSIIRSPQVALIAREFSFSSVVKALDRSKKLEAIVLTCSAYQSQEIWLRELINTKVHMVWYAQSWKPHSYIADTLESYIPNLPLISVDKHWVWTDNFAAYLQSIGIKESFEVVGSIVWQLPQLKMTSDLEIQLTIFDVSPFSDSVATSCGHVCNYHHPNNLFLFLKDILNTIENIEKSINIKINLSLKTKRGYKPAYNKDYFLYLDELVKSGKIILESHSVNIYSLISSSDLVIAYPFTSPLYIADQLNVPSIYYDPTSSICNHNFSNNESLISFANNKNLLEEKILNIINNCIFSKN